MFCVHGGSGTILLFHALGRRLSKKRPVYGLQAVGLYGGEPPQRTVEEMAQRYLGEMKQVQPRGPYALAGWCFGGIVAYEMARTLLAAGEEVLVVAMLNTMTPEAELALLKRDLAAVPREGTRDRMRARWHHSAKKSPPTRVFGQAAALAQGAVKKVGTKGRKAVIDARNGVRDLRVERALKAGRPLPDGLRDAQFRNLAMGAQMRYSTPVAPVPVAVFRSAGEYDTADLGWDAVALAPAVAFEIAGGMASQRASMEEPYVRLVADPLESLLEEREHAVDAVGVTASGASA